MAQRFWMLDTHALSELIRDPSGTVMQRVLGLKVEDRVASSPAA
jgi:hypothetical protein